MSVSNDRHPAPHGHRHYHGQSASTRHTQDLAMTEPREILFVDPAIADLATISGNLRPGVEAFLLDSATPAARQIAAALAERRGLDAVHVIAPGAPGRGD